MYIFTNDDFINKAKEIHNNKYNYNNVNFTNMTIKVKIECNDHGIFEQSPSNHITNKQGCPTCANNYLSNTPEFIEKAKKIHGNKYDYTEVDYINNCTKVKIICNEHGEFEQTPQNHLFGYNCKNCGIEAMKIKQKTNIDDFIIHANIIHNNKYEYSNINYINARTKISINCKEHGVFKQLPDSHLRGTGCSRCAGNNLSNTNEFIEKAKKIHFDKYDYLKVDYVKSDQKVTINCKKHGYFDQTPSNHLYGFGCSRCYSKYSKSQIIWLNLLEKLHNIYIIHMENEGEYKIPNTNYKADGYCKETNTIYEFHGDYWHGNPNIYNPDEINKVTNSTFRELYEKTLEKEECIKKEGFNLITIWESDWIKINKCVKILQKKIRNSIN
jgi:Zn finger protein HypA/HybF involved in hydrogenase expression